MNRQQRQALLIRLEEEGKTNDGHLFIVKNTEKREDKQYWVPVPGSSISMFLTSYHEFKYLGPANSAAVKAKLFEIDEAQLLLVGEKAAPEVDHFDVLVDLADLGLKKEPTKKHVKPEGEKPHV
jgi:hypothetical protein